MGLFRWISVLQGAYFVITGLWPMVSMRSFEAVTGPKRDKWLVRTVGVLVIVIGGVLVVAGLRGPPPPEVVGLGIASALALAGVDVNYVLRGRIPPIYLLDALGECVIVGLWVLAIVLS